MFEKLLAILPSNPGVAHQLAFYARRMREEAAIRRVGMFFIVMAFFIQFFAVLSPPVSTSAYSSNDLIDGGVSSTNGKAEIVSHCRNNVKSYGDVMHTFGISCDDIAGGTVTTINSNTTNAAGNQLYSLGWLPHATGVDGTSADQTAINVLNYPQPVFSRLLRSWDSNHTTGSSYKAVRFTVTDPEGHSRVYFILFTCGNLVAFTSPTPRPVCPFNHNILQGDAGCYCPFSKSYSPSDSRCYCPFNKAYPPSDSRCYCPFNHNLPAGDSQCHCPFNPNIPPTDAGCYCKFNKSLSATDAKCACPYNKAISATDVNCYCSFNNTISATDAKCHCPFNSSLSAGDSKCYCPFNQKLSYNDSKCFCTVPDKTTISKDSADCFPPCKYNNSIAADDAKCKPCERALSSEDTTACITIHKTAIYGTTSGPNADGTQAKAGDVITYTLYAENKGKDTVKGFVFVENLSDVLDYADVTDLHGGTLDKTTNVVTWPAEAIKSGETASHQITVTVKSPIPQTPPAPSDPQHFDLTMTNVYGNAINITLPAAPPQVVQQTAANLPNTGPGSGLIIAAAVMVLGGFFYSRARLLQEESTIAVQEAANA